MFGCELRARGLAPQWGRFGRRRPVPHSPVAAQGIHHDAEDQQLLVTDGAEV